MEYLKELWNSKYIVIDRKVIFLLFVGYMLYKGYAYAYNKGATDMYGYIMEELNKPEKVRAESY